MSEAEEDDYLADLDKFLVNSDKSAAKTYSDHRKDAQKRSKLKNEQNKLKGRRQRELESREEGLSKSLFERAKEDEDAGIGSGNKALSIMMKMGFKPGQSLGKTDEPSDSKEKVFVPSEVSSSPGPSHVTPKESQPQHTTEPLPLNEWAGKKGIGLGSKRGPSPTSVERVAKMAKMEEETSHRDFRDRARQEYEERRAEGRLAPAQRTCAALDEKAGKSFHVLWLDPRNPESFPSGLMEALQLHLSLVISASDQERERHGESVKTRLRRQMQADSLLPLDTDDPSATTALSSNTDTDIEFSPEILEEAAQFLRLQASDRLQLVLSYLRENYAYCFWCGTQYNDGEEMDTQCPGNSEDAHD